MTKEDFEYREEEVKGTYHLKSNFCIKIVEYHNGIFIPLFFNITDWENLNSEFEEISKQCNSLDEAIKWSEYYLNKIS